MGFTFPAPPASPTTGSQFSSAIYAVDGPAREDAVLQQLVAGNVPDFLRMPVTVAFTTGNHTLVVEVLPDYLAVGTDEDFLRTPMWPTTAQRVADAFNAALPTRRLVNQIWKMAALHVSPRPLQPTAQMGTTSAFVKHNDLIELQRSGRGGLMAGHKKDIVLTPRLTSGHVAIYGWHELSGDPIQPLNPTSHSSTYVDYSHGVRLVSRDVLLDGQPARYEDVLKDPLLSVLLSDEGPSTVGRYPGVA